MCVGVTMRSPAYGARRPDADFQQFLAPESFTVLPPENGSAPTEPYKVTPPRGRRRKKNQAFSIIAEPTTSQTSSRSTSPAGRVSPFRGRGFNPTGSRHASPERSTNNGLVTTGGGGGVSTSNKSRTSSNRVSYIPKPIPRRSSAEDLSEPLSPTFRSRGAGGGGGTSNGTGGGLRGTASHSRSMTNIAPRHLVAKPPPSPRRSSNLKSSFVRLSPILGSSPGSASDQTVSSPSRIPRSKSQPPSRMISPRPDASGHYPSSRPDLGPNLRPNARPDLRPNSRPGSRPNSRPSSRPTSPNTTTSPSKIPLKSSSYKHIPAKVDSFQRTATAAAAKPKVPLKPKVYSTRASIADRSKSTLMKKTAKPQPDDTETTDTDRETVRSAARGVYSVKDSKRKDPRGRGTTLGDNKPGKPGSRYASKENLRCASKENLKYSSKENLRYTSKENLRYGSKDNSRYASKENLQYETEETEDTNYSKDSYGDTKLGTSNRAGSHATYSRERSHTDIPTNSRRNDNSRQTEKSGAKPHDTTTTVSTTEEVSRTEDETTEDGRDDDILSVTIDSLGPSTTQIVSATTETVTKPLNIEAKLLRPSDLTDASLDNANVQKTGSATNNTVSPNLNTRANVTASQTGNVGGSIEPTQPSNGSIRASPIPARSQGLQQNHPAPEDATANNNSKRVTHTDLTSLEMNARNSLNSLVAANDGDKVSQKALLDSPRVATGAGTERLRPAHTVIVDEIQPIKITVREKTADLDVQSGNFGLPRSAANGLSERPLVPPNNAQHNNSEQPSDEPKKPGPCSRFIACCKRPKDTNIQQPSNRDVEAQHTEESSKRSFWSKLRCKRNKVTDTAKTTSCFDKFKRNKQQDNWADRRDSILSEPPKKQGCCGRLSRFFSASCCTKCRRKPVPESVSRRTSMLSKKKSLSSTMQTPPPPEDTRSKIDVSLVEHTSHMRGAIPVLPVPLAWICLICNIFLPGFGTILSGLLCLCIGKPRFSPKDGIKPRIGAFLIDIIVGISQMFTVLFCLVGWGWSIWWGVIMLKIARKHKKIKLAERNQIEEQPTSNANHLNTDSQRAR